MQREAIFEIPFYKSKCTEHEKIKKFIFDKIVPDFLANGFNAPDRNLYSSYFPNVTPLYSELFLQFYKKDIDNFMRVAGFDPMDNWSKRIAFWYNIGVAGTFQETHTHLGGPPAINYAAVHYVKFDKTQHTSTMFFHPLGDVIKAIQPTELEEKPIDFMNLSKSPEVDEGDLIFFPSYLHHRVNKQTSDELRITISFNMTIFK